MIRVLIADDQDLVRGALAALLGCAMPSWNTGWTSPCSTSRCPG